jgi:transketolase
MEPEHLGPRDFYEFHSGAPSHEHYVRALDELKAALERQTAGAGIKPVALQSSPKQPSDVKPTASSMHRLIPAYAQALVAAGERHKRIFALDGDLVKDCGVTPFRDAFPDRYIECGIAEQDMVSMAGGLSLSGYLPIVHSFASFLTPRANEQMYNNATEHTKIIYVGSLAGVLPGGPGHSHQSVRDIALMASVPGMTLFEPASGREAAMALDWMIEQAEGPCYLRLVSIPVALTYDGNKFGELVAGRGTVMTEGADAVLFAYGPVMLSEAVAAAQQLKADAGLGVRVINLPWLNRIDAGWLRDCIADVPYALSIDNHYLSGGQGERLAATIAEFGLSRMPVIKRLGLDQIPACGTNAEVLQHHRLDRDGIAASIRAVVGK